MIEDMTRNGRPRTLLYVVVRLRVQLARLHEAVIPTVVHAVDEDAVQQQFGEQLREEGVAGASAREPMTDIPNFDGGGSLPVTDATRCNTIGRVAMTSASNWSKPRWCVMATTDASSCRPAARIMTYEKYFVS
jgi:hypothetical protein